MNRSRAIAIIGTFDSKGEEHRFLRDCVEKRGHKTLTINVGTKRTPAFQPDMDLFSEVVRRGGKEMKDRDRAVQGVITRGGVLIRELYEKGEIKGVVSAGGGTGTHIGTSVMRALPVGVPKVMVSTVASRDMSGIVGTKDITMIHSVADILGVNSILGRILDQAAGAVCGMADGQWEAPPGMKRIGLSMFGFVTEAAEGIKRYLEEMKYEVVAFHANGTGGMAMEALAREGHFDGLLDLATHELADELKGGYCKGIGPERLEPISGRRIPRLVVPGGLDCAVLEFTRQTVPDTYRARKIFYYDFRSAIRLDEEETRFIASQLAEKLNKRPLDNSVLVPMKGWSEADREDGPLYDPDMRDLFLEVFKGTLDPGIVMHEVDHHINDEAFARIAATRMDEMFKRPNVLQNSKS
jgi:uncharacterized protein (UPF0261 family)